jgi:hypothetical protein
VPNPTKPDVATMLENHDRLLAEIRERLGGLEEAVGEFVTANGPLSVATSRAEVDELMGALGLPVEPIDPWRELDRLAERLGVLGVLSQTIVATVTEMTHDLAETRQALEELYR